jgi:hypothetical protein
LISAKGIDQFNDEVRKRRFFAPFHAKNDGHFAETGSGQTRIGKAAALKKRAVINNST